MPSGLEITRPLMLMQVLVTLGLALLIRILYVRLMRESFLRWWALAWIADSAYLATLWWWVETAVEGWLRGGLALASAVAGLLEVALLLVAALSVERRSPMRRAVPVSLMGVALAGGVAVFLASLSAPDASVAFAIRSVPRGALLGLASLYSAIVFFRHWRKAGIPGGEALSGACLAHGTVYLLFPAYLAYIFPLRGSARVVSSVWMATLSLLAKAGMVLAAAVVLLKKAEKAENEFRASEERCRDLIENASELICVADREGRITSLNRAGERILGYSRTEAHGLPIERILALESRAIVRQIYQFSSGERSQGGMQELGFLTRDGRQLTLEASCRVLSQGGSVRGMECISRDVTERKSMEQQLRQSQKMEAIGVLAGGVAHDFNNLLTIINGFADLAVAELREHPCRADVLEIRKAGERAAALTRQLLAFSRKQLFDRRVLDLNEVVNSVGVMLKRLVGEQVEFIMELEPSLWRVKAYPSQLEEVIFNLAANARDAMPTGGRLTIRTANVVLDETRARFDPEAQPGPYVMLSVRDTGEGMDEETRLRLFEPFFSTKRAGKGTGLGLATVYGAVHQSGGHITVDTAPGRGTTFEVYLPQCLDEPEPKEAVATAGSSRPATETVLVVEDEQDVRSLACRILREAGYRVLEACGGAEAVALFERRSGQIDLVLTDLVMPGMSGQELGECLRRLDPRLRIVYMSGYSPEAVADGLPGDSASSYLAKPFSSEALQLRIREVLGSERSAA